LGRRKKRLKKKDRKENNKSKRGCQGIFHLSEMQRKSSKKFIGNRMVNDKVAITGAAGNVATVSFSVRYAEQGEDL
jgi:hypothetical protein